MIAPVGVPGPPPSPERLAEQVATQGRSLDTARAGLHVPSAFPCGYCRLDSTCSVGDRCPWCGRCKAPLWWKTCVPTTATTTPSQPGRHSAPSSQLAPLRRNAVAIILVVNRYGTFTRVDAVTQQVAEKAIAFPYQAPLGAAFAFVFALLLGRPRIAEPETIR